MKHQLGWSHFKKMESQEAFSQALGNAFEGVAAIISLTACMTAVMALVFIA